MSTRPSPPRCADGSTPSTYTSPMRAEPGCSCTLVQWKPSSRPVAESTASRNPAGSNHGSAMRTRRSSSVHLPCSGCWAKAALFTASQVSSSSPGRNARSVTPSGTTGGGNSAVSGRRICQSTRAREKPRSTASAAADGWSPCAQARSGPDAASTTPRASARPEPRRRYAGCTTISTPTPSAGAVVSRCAYPERVPSVVRAVRCTAGASGSRSRSSTCSSSGSAPSASPAARASASTSVTSSGVRRSARPIRSAAVVGSVLLI